MSAFIKSLVIRQRQQEADAKDRARFLASAKGDPGPAGPAPEHEVKGNKIRFPKPDGEWGAWVEAPAGKDGKDGKDHGTVIIRGGGPSGTDLSTLLPGNENTEPAAIAVLQGGQWVKYPWVAFLALTGSGDTPQAKRIDFVGDSIIYKGEAAPGTADTDPSWCIRRLEFTPGQDGQQDVNETFAAGTAEHIHAWTDRETLEYI